MKFKITDFEFKQCDVSDLNRIMEIQDEALMHIESPVLLRKNTPEMLGECLQSPNVTLGAWYKDRLIAFSVLYFPNDEDESLVKSLEGVETEGLSDANYKLCIVDKEFRGNSLQYELGVRLLQYALQKDVNIICVTASPHNAHSIANIERMGFVYNRTLTKYGFVRNLYYKML